MKKGAVYVSVFQLALSGGTKNRFEGQCLQNEDCANSFCCMRGTCQNPNYCLLGMKEKGDVCTFNYECGSRCCDAYCESVEHCLTNLCSQLELCDDGQQVKRKDCSRNPQNCFEHSICSLFLYQ